jgi:hypothetical protein
MHSCLHGNAPFGLRLVSKWLGTSAELGSCKLHGSDSSAQRVTLSKGEHRRIDIAAPETVVPENSEGMS